MHRARHTGRAVRTHATSTWYVRVAYAAGINYWQVHTVPVGHDVVYEYESCLPHAPILWI